MRPRADLDRTWALVPLRGLEDAKTRLGGELDAEERLELVRAMATRTLVATGGARGITGTILVTADPAAAALAQAHGAGTLVQRLPGLNAALQEARLLAVAAGATAVLVVPIDLPAIDATSVDALLDEARTAAGNAPSAPLVAAVPDRHGQGTNALLVAPPDSIEPAFGEGSLAAHRAAALAAGATFIELGGPLRFDVDTAADLLAAEALHGAGVANGGGDAA
jgi:2-phospho-L-lactate guanylyltransferase